MEPIIVSYIGLMSILGLFAINNISNKCYYNSGKKYIEKKKFKRYHCY